MKNIFLILFMFVGLGLSAQTNVDYATIDNSALPDTLTNSDTLTYSFSEIFYQPGIVECYVDLDSLSGTPSGTAYLEASYRTAGDNWYTVDSGNLSDAAAALDDILVDANAAALRYRVQIRTSGTMSVKVDNCDCVYKRDNR